MRTSDGNLMKQRGFRAGARCSAVAKSEAEPYPAWETGLEQELRRSRRPENLELPFGKTHFAQTNQVFVNRFRPYK
jgi:hypothetical protein